MARINLLPSAPSTDSSSEFTVAENARVGVIGRGGSGIWEVSISIKASDGSWVSIGSISGKTASVLLNIPGVYLVTRLRGTVLVDAIDLPAAAVASGGTTNGLTNDQLRAGPVGVSAASLPLPAGAATEATLAAASDKLAGIGLPGDAVASSDTGAFGLVSLVKRLLAKFPGLGPRNTATSMSVSIATDDAQIGTKPTASGALGAGASGMVGWLATIRDVLYNSLPATLGIKASAGSLSVTPASDANVAREVYASVTILEALTSAANGATGTVLGALPCTSFDLVNDATVNLEYQRNGAGVWMPLPVGGSRWIQGITNANQISVRRRDLVATGVRFVGEGFAV